MRRREDKVVLRTLRLLIICQVATALEPLAVMALWGINFGYIIRLAVPIGVAIYLGRELASRGDR